MSEFVTAFKHIPEKTRCAESSRMRQKYPGRSCIIVDRASDTNAPSIDKHKYLVPDDITVGQFLYVIRKRLKLNPEKAIFIFINKKLPPSSMLMSEAYKEYHDRDGFLYMIYTSENTFG